MASEIEVRPLRDDPADRSALGRILEDAFAGPFAETWYRDVGIESLRVAVRGGKVVGGYANYRVAQWFGGRAVPMGAIAAVAVAAEDRATGVGAAIMADAVSECGRLGLPISTLYPATYPVYRRAGYETAGAYVLHRFKPHDVDVKGGGRVVRPLLPEDAAAVAALYEARARTNAGCMERNAWLMKRLHEHPSMRIQRYGVEGKGGLEGYVAYSQPLVPNSQHYEIRVRDWAVATPEAGDALLAFFAKHRSMCDAIFLPGAPVEPLLLRLREEPLGVERRVHWMTRIVDVPAALEARGYGVAASGRLHLEVADPRHKKPLRYVLEVSEGRAVVHPGGEGKVRLDVRGLSPLYTGQLSAEAVAVAGLASGDARDLALATSLFAGPTPWMPEVF